MDKGEYQTFASHFDSEFNRRLRQQFQAAEQLPGVKKTHFFNGRYENIYLDENQVPALAELKADARARARQILGHSPQSMGCWFNAMGPNAETTLHSHDDDDEALSGVYYVQVPPDSGRLLIHRDGEVIAHPPREGQWVFFSPRTPHAVEPNHSRQLRLSIAFNFC